MTKKVQFRASLDRTIGEAEEQGYTHLRATCPGCKRIADVPWPLLLGRKGTNRETFLGNIPLRCQRCGNAAPIIGVRQNNTAEPSTGTASAGALAPTAIPATPTDRIDGCP